MHLCGYYMENKPDKGLRERLGLHYCEKSRDLLSSRSVQRIDYSSGSNYHLVQTISACDADEL
jgi:hypothetical protein